MFSVIPQNKDGQSKDNIAEVYIADDAEYKQNRETCMAQVNEVLDQPLNLDLHDGRVLEAQVANLQKLAHPNDDSELVWDVLSEMEDCKTLRELMELILRLQSDSELRLIDPKEMGAYLAAITVIRTMFGPLSPEHRAVRLYIRDVNGMARDFGELIESL